jgi:hypothetical protein
MLAACQEPRCPEEERPAGDAEETEGSLRPKDDRTKRSAIGM